MSDFAIKVNNLSKIYHLGELHKRSNSFREKMTNIFRRDGISKEDETIWALKNVSFEVKKGEIIGIIGRNGAGKSTLLKILSRITKPTEGNAWFNGRVSSLLEVGIGFHPEMTGRENAFLNGAILGMKKSEIKRVWDEIVNFAEIEKFVDTPVKRYSSGMYVRLAFAVAAHLDPEILLVDEVLAVGDVAFQKKCLGKMDDVAKKGRTVLLVSHNMGSIRSLCKRALCINKGRLILDDDVEKVVSSYLNLGLVESPVILSDEISDRMEGRMNRKNPIIRFKKIAILNQTGIPQKIFYSDEDIVVSVMFKCFNFVTNIRVLIYLVDENNIPLLVTHNLDDSKMAISHHPLTPGVYDARCIFPKNTFGERRFYLTVELLFPKTEHLVVRKILGFEVKFKGYNNVHDGYEAHTHFRPQLDWSIQPISSE